MRVEHSYGGVGVAIVVVMLVELLHDERQGWLWCQNCNDCERCEKYVRTYVRLRICYRVTKNVTHD